MKTCDNRENGFTLNICLNKKKDILLLIGSQMDVQIFWQPSLSHQSGISLSDKRMISIRCFKKHDWCYEWRIEVSLDGAASFLNTLGEFSPTIKKNFHNLCIYKQSMIQYLWWSLIKRLPTLVELFFGHFSLNRFKVHWLWWLFIQKSYFTVSKSRLRKWPKNSQQKNPDISFANSLLCLS